MTLSLINQLLTHHGKKQTMTRKAEEILSFIDCYFTTDRRVQGSDTRTHMPMIASSSSLRLRHKETYLYITSMYVYIHTFVHVSYERKLSTLLPLQLCFVFCMFFLVFYDCVNKPSLRWFSFGHGRRSSHSQIVSLLPLISLLFFLRIS